MFQKIAKHRANDASNDVHRPPLLPGEEYCKVRYSEQAQAPLSQDDTLSRRKRAHDPDNAAATSSA